MRIAFLFAGQGAQKTGMGESLRAASPAAARIFQRADALTDGKVTNWLIGAQEELDDTRAAQPCLLTCGVAAAEAMREAGAEPFALAGFSLGEYAALSFGGAVTFDDALSLVMKRAEWMHECALSAPGGMAACIGELSAVRDACRQAGGFVTPVNYNCPNQTVIAGDEDALTVAMRLFEGAGGRAVRLATKGAFHSERMRDAAEKLYAEWKTRDVSAPKIPVYANVNAEPIPSADVLPELMRAQAMSPVLWERTIRNLLRDGAEAFVECGPGGVLSGFIKRIDRKTPCFRVEDEKSLQDAIAGVKG